MEPEWTRPADEQIMKYLRDHPPDYVPLVANRLGIHLSYAERRVEVLVERGLLEAVTEESIYRLTERGERFLAGELGSPVTADD